jgi:DNA-binding transcriptional MerR regulator
MFLRRVALTGENPRPTVNSANHHGAISTAAGDASDARRSGVDELRGPEQIVPTAMPEQGTLFDDPSPAADDMIGYRGPTACSAANITYRQLDYWARTELVVPSIRTASGSGSQRLYSFKDILVLKVVKRLLDAGVSLHNIRVAVDALRLRGAEDLAQLTLLSDGTTVYQCTNNEEVVDLLRGGQGVFGIAVSGALRELVGSLATLPGERADGAQIDEVAASADDELAQRRQRRSATA